MSPRELTRTDVLRAARTFRSLRKMPKWRVRVEDRELPARPLVLAAAGVPPNDPTNSHQAVAILERLGFEVRYAGADPAGEDDKKTADAPSLAELLVGLAKEASERDWRRLPRNLAKEVDRYLYADKKPGR